MKFRFLVLLSTALYLLLTTPSPEAQTYAFIPSSGDGNVTRVATGDETIAAVAFGDDPYGAAVTPQGDYLVVTRPSADSITVVRTANFTTTGAQVDRSVGDEPRGVAFESRGLYAYVANFAADTVSEFYIPSFTVTDTINVGDGPWGVAATYDEIDATPKVYVANYLGNSISVITNDGVETITSVGNGPVGLSLTPDGAYLYVALKEDDAAAVIRTSDNTLVKTISAGDGPWGVGVGSDGAYVYITNSLDDTVTVIDAGSQSFLDSYDVGGQPLGVACPKNGDFAYVVNQTGNSISKIDIDSQTVTEVGAGRISGAYALGGFIGGTPPAAPANLAAEKNGNDEIDLTWTDNSSDELGFKIERRLDTETHYTQVATVGANVTDYTDTGLESGKAYTFRVRAYNESADSDYSASAGATTDEGRFSWCFIQALLD
jgi:YVTN family beta-propeller protein